MSTLYGETYSKEYLEAVMAMERLLRIGHKYKVTKMHLDTGERWVGFYFDKVNPEVIPP